MATWIFVRVLGTFIFVRVVVTLMFRLVGTLVFRVVDSFQGNFTEGCWAFFLQVAGRHSCLGYSDFFEFVLQKWQKTSSAKGTLAPRDLRLLATFIVSVLIGHLAVVGRPATLLPATGQSQKAAYRMNAYHQKQTLCSCQRGLAVVGRPATLLPAPGPTQRRHVG